LVSLTIFCFVSSRVGEFAAWTWSSRDEKDEVAVTDMIFIRTLQSQNFGKNVKPGANELVFGRNSRQRQKAFSKE